MNHLREDRNPVCGSPNRRSYGDRNVLKAASAKNVVSGPVPGRHCCAGPFRSVGPTLSICGASKVPEMATHVCRATEVDSALALTNKLVDRIDRIPHISVKAEIVCVDPWTDTGFARHSCRDKRLDDRWSKKRRRRVPTQGDIAVLA